MPGGRDCFCFLLIGRRSTLTRDAILPEVPLVGKFRFFRLEPSVIDSTVLETSSTICDRPFGNKLRLRRFIENQQEIQKRSEKNGNYAQLLAS